MSFKIVLKDKVHPTYNFPWRPEHLFNGIGVLSQEAYSCTVDSILTYSTNCDTFLYKPQYILSFPQ